jgi:2-keto-3-deoxy-L-rhamnonate aldolase RhmA
MIENSIMQRNREGRKAVAFGLIFPSMQLIEIAAQCGFDSINVDGEHGHFTPESVDEICRVANGYGMSVTARVPNISSDTINLFLDRGVQGIVGPHIDNVEQAQMLADACLFPPAGQRSWGGGRGTEFGDDEKITAMGGKLSFSNWSNANMLVFGQIESKTGWENLEEILTVPGLTGVTAGPNDFTASLGHPGEPDHPESLAAWQDVVSKTRASGKHLASDFSVTLGIGDLMFENARAFVNSNRNHPFGS